MSASAVGGPGPAFLFIPKQPPSAKSCSARVSSPPLYERGAIRIPTSVTVEGLNARTCSFEHPPSRYQIGTEFERLNTEVMRERMNMLVLDWRRSLYFFKKSYAIFVPRAAALVATGTLGPGICICPRPMEVVDWYGGGHLVVTY